MNNNGMAENFGQLIKERRLVLKKTLQEIGATSGVSTSHLDRIERGERFPSGRILQKLAPALGYTRTGIFVLAGFLLSEDGEAVSNLDPYVSQELAKEPIEVQRAVIALIPLFKTLAQTR